MKTTDTDIDIVCGVLLLAAFTAFTWLCVLFEFIATDML